jgi:hypothetical protein
MISVKVMVPDVSQDRLGTDSGLTAPETALFLESARPLLQPTGVFDEVKPASVLPPDLVPWAAEWGESVIIGLCSLGREAGAAAAGGREARAWKALLSLVLRDALDFLEYRVRQYLKPTGRKPGYRLIPGCPELPLAANFGLVRHFEPDRNQGLEVGPGGEIGGAPGLAFIYPTSENLPRLSGLCAQCRRTDCPSRRLEE